MSADAATISAPNKLLTVFEPGRALCEYGLLLPAMPVLNQVPDGDGHPVMVFPGFLASDVSTVELRRYLKRWGYTPYTWGAGRNLGLRVGDDLEERLVARVQALYERHGEPLTLIGWSLGGVFARETARQLPDCVRGIITLGSPLGNPRGTNVWRIYEHVTGMGVESETLQARIEQVCQPVPGIPSTAVFSRSDSIVSWEIAREQKTELTENVQVSSSHFGLGHNPVVLYVIADRLHQLTQPEWAPFKYDGWRNLFYA